MSQVSTSSWLAGKSVVWDESRRLLVESKQLTDNLKNIDKATQHMKADSAKHDRLAREMVKGMTAELGAGVRAAV